MSDSLSLLAFIPSSDLRRYSELDRVSREKDVKIEQLKESYQELEEKWQQINDQHLQLRQQLNEKQREHEHHLREKDTQASRYVSQLYRLAQSCCSICSLQDEINRIKKEWNHQLTQISKEHANENIEHRALEEECDTLKGELKLKDNHIQR